MERTCEAPSNEAPHMILGYRQGRLPTYLQSTVAHAVPLSVCFMVVFACYSHQNRFPTAAFSRRRSAAFLQTSDQFVQHFSCADLFTLRFPHPFLRGTALTANPLSKYVNRDGGRSLPHPCTNEQSTWDDKTKHMQALWNRNRSSQNMLNHVEFQNNIKHSRICLLAILSST